jgi:hypothetical protein
VDQQGLVDAHADEENHKIAIQGGGQAFFVDHDVGLSSCPVLNETPHRADLGRTQFFAQDLAQALCSQRLDRSAGHGGDYLAQLCIDERLVSRTHRLGSISEEFEDLIV